MNDVIKDLAVEHFETESLQNQIRSFACFNRANIFPSSRF